MWERTKWQTQMICYHVGQTLQVDDEHMEDKERFLQRALNLGNPPGLEEKVDESEMPTPRGGSLEEFMQIFGGAMQMGPPPGPPQGQQVVVVP